MLISIVQGCGGVGARFDTDTGLDILDVLLAHTDFLSLWCRGRVSKSEDDHVRDVTTVTVAPLHISSYVSPWEIQGS